MDHQIDDISLRSVQPLAELTLGSLNASSVNSNSGIIDFDGALHTAPQFRFSTAATTSSPTTATSSAPVATPSPPQVSRKLRKGEQATPRPMKRVQSEEDTEGDEIPLENPPREKLPEVHPRKSRSHVEKAPTSLTLREQEKTIDQLNKKIWSLQLKIHYLEERLDQSQPETHQAVARQNVALKIEVHTLETELKKCKKLTLRLEKELESLGSGVGREQELERKLEEKEREIRELRKSRGSHFDADTSAAALQDAEDRIMDLEDHTEALEGELDAARHQLDGNIEEVQRLKDALTRQPDGRRIAELEDVNEELNDRLADHEDLLARRDEEREDFLDEIEGLRLQLEDLHRRRESEAAERSESRAEIYDRQEEQEMIEGEVNALRDKLARTTLDLEMREEELDQKQREIEDIVDQFKEQIENREDEWKGEVKEARVRVEELRDIIAEREVEARELRIQVSDLEAESTSLERNYENAILNLQDEAKQKDVELDAANQEVQRLGDRVYELEEEGDRYREDAERWKDDVAAERARLEGTVAALKERLAGCKAELQNSLDQHQQAQKQMVAHRERQEQLAKHIEDLVEELEASRDTQQQLQLEQDATIRKHEDDLRKERRAFDAKDSELKSTLEDLAKASTALDRLKKDYDALQNAHKDVKALGDSQTADRFSLQLVIDRLRRDVQRLEEELKRARKDLEEREDKIRDRETALDELHVENRSLSTQLASQTQARLNLAEKLDTAQATLKACEADLNSARGRLHDAEAALSKSHRGQVGAETQFRDQLTERNTLLLTIYQYLDKIAGVDKSLKKGGSSETKPFTNFGVFHDNIINRLKSLSQIQIDFDRRCKDAELRYSERLDTIKRQLDARWRQLDKFEASVGKIADQKAAWRRKFHEKDGELEVARAAHADASAQLAILRRAPQTDTSGLKSMTARAVNAEKRLTNIQNQLLATEEKMLSMKERTENAENKWEARVKEYETRVRACEEKVKRERQGAKERVGELEVVNKAMQKQYDQALKRVQQLQELLDGSSKAKNALAP